MDDAHLSTAPAPLPIDHCQISERLYLTVKEFCRLTSMSASTLKRLRDKGKLPFLQPGGKRTRVLIPRNALELNSQQGESGLPSQSTPKPNEPNCIPGPMPRWMQRRP